MTKALVRYLSPIAWHLFVKRGPARGTRAHFWGTMISAIIFGLVLYFVRSHR